MIIKLTRFSPLFDLNNQVIYVNTDHISVFYKTDKRLDDKLISVTHINMIDGSIDVYESHKEILKMIQPMPLCVDTNLLSPEDIESLRNAIYDSKCWALRIYP